MLQKLSEFHQNPFLYSLHWQFVNSRLQRFFIDILVLMHIIYSKTCVNRPLSKRPKIGFQGQILLNAGQKLADCCIAECYKRIQQ